MVLGTRTLVNVNDPPPFDPDKNVRFRGRLISELNEEELREALRQALTALNDANGRFLFG